MSRDIPIVFACEKDLEMALVSDRELSDKLAAAMGIREKYEVRNQVNLMPYGILDLALVTHDDYGPHRFYGVELKNEPFKMDHLIQCARYSWALSTLQHMASMTIVTTNKYSPGDWVYLLEHMSVGWVTFSISSSMGISFHWRDWEDPHRGNSHDGICETIQRKEFERAEEQRDEKYRKFKDRHREFMSRSGLTASEKKSIQSGTLS